MSFEENFTYKEFQETTTLHNAGKTTPDKRYTYIGIVTDNNDPLDLGRVKVKVVGLDTIAQWSFPKLPKYLHMIPQVDETVFLEIPNVDKPNNERYYYPTIISSIDRIKKDTWFKNIGVILKEQITPNSTNKSFDQETKGIYPEKNDIALLGRNNTDVILRDEQVILRAGKHLQSEPLKANTKNPSTLTLLLNNDGSVSSLVNQADIVYLLTHKSSSKAPISINKTNIDELYNKTRPTLYGDTLYELLSLLIDAFLSHEHPISGRPPLNHNLVEKLKKYKRDIIINQNVRVN